MSDTFPLFKSSELGFLTTYGIEYIFDYLGEERIRQRLEEVKNKPTIGIPLREFLTGKGELEYLSGKGILYIFLCVIDYFPYEDVAQFLYQKSKEINEKNNYTGKYLSKHHQEYLLSIQKMIYRNPEDMNYYLNEMQNHYLMEYHFFILSIFRLLKRQIENPEVSKFLLEVFPAYDVKIEAITSQFKSHELYWAKDGLGNSIYRVIADDYHHKGDKKTARKIENKYKKLGWR